MKPRVQSSLLLLITLAIGVLLGALLQSSLREKRIKHMMFLRSHEEFVSQIEKVIDPTSAEQAAQVSAILEESAPEITAAAQQHREWVRLRLDVLESRLAPLLDEEQQRRLKHRLHPPRPPREEEKESFSGTK